MRRRQHLSRPVLLLTAQKGLLRRTFSWTPLTCVEISLAATKYRPVFGRISAKKPAGFLGAKMGGTGDSRSNATVRLCPRRQRDVFLIELSGTWFRFLIKQTKRENPSTDPSYVWDKIGFFTNWLSADQQVILCFDLPSTLQSRLQSTLPSNSENFSLNDPYSLHATIVEEVSATFNNSVWSLRDLVRMVEKVISFCILRTNTSRKTNTGT